MKRLVLILSMILLVLLSSCMKGDFSVDFSTLEKNLVKDGEELKKFLTISVLASDRDASYSYGLTGPDGDLKWEGEFYWADNVLKSDELLYPSYLDFPEGDYALSIHSSKGNDLKLTLHLGAGESVLYSMEEAKLTEGVELLYWDADGDKSEPEDAVSYEYSYVDRFGTHVTARGFI